MNETEKAFEHYLYCPLCTAHQDPRFTSCLCCGGKIVSAQQSVQWMSGTVAPVKVDSQPEDNQLVELALAAHR